MIYVKDNKKKRHVSIITYEECCYILFCFFYPSPLFFPFMYFGSVASFDYVFEKYLFQIIDQKLYTHTIYMLTYKDRNVYIYINHQFTRSPFT